MNAKSTTIQADRHSCAVTARDFSTRVNDPVRDQWTPGKLRNLITALNGSPVAIITDAQTGTTQLGVRLTGVHRDTVAVTESLYVDQWGRNLEQPRDYTTLHPIYNIGQTIIPLRNNRAKWRALDTWRIEMSVAIDWAAEESDLLEKTEGYQRLEMSARPDLCSVLVSAADCDTNRQLWQRWVSLEDLEERIVDRLLHRNHQ